MFIGLLGIFYCSTLFLISKNKMEVSASRCTMYTSAGMHIFAKSLFMMEATCLGAIVVPTLLLTHPVSLKITLTHPSVCRLPQHTCQFANYLNAPISLQTTSIHHSVGRLPQHTCQFADCLNTSSLSYVYIIQDLIS